MRKLFKERKLFKGGNYMRKYGIWKIKMAPYCFLLFFSANWIFWINKAIIKAFFSNFLYKLLKNLDYQKVQK